MKWSKEKHNYLVELKLSDKYTWKQIAEQMTAKFPFKYTDEQCRNRWRTNRHKINDEINPKDKYGKKIKRNEDGSVEVDQLIEISKEQLKDDKYILKAHGYDDSWEIVSHDFSMWNHFNKELTEPKTLYASKIRVKPKENGFDWDKLIDIVNNVKPIELKKHRFKVKDKQLLEVPLFDQHFGINDSNDYKDTQDKINRLIVSRIWEQIVITIGSDMLHHDNFQNKTVSGTEIQHVCMVAAWDEALKFYRPIIEKAIRQSNETKVIYVPGNHDQSLSWSFTKMLEAMYPQVKFDTDLQERKAHSFSKVFIGYAHGDKGAKRLPRLFPVEYPKEWANAKTRELHAGHIHHEVTKDEFGLTMRSMSTRARTDSWHRDNGYVGAHKRFMVFEYSESELESIHYV